MTRETFVGATPNGIPVPQPRHFPVLPRKLFLHRRRETAPLQRTPIGIIASFVRDVTYSHDKKAETSPDASRQQDEGPVGDGYHLAGVAAPAPDEEDRRRDLPLLYSILKTPRAFKTPGGDDLSFEGFNFGGPPRSRSSYPLGPAAHKRGRFVM